MKEMTFEEKLQRLEEIISKINKNDLGLETSMSLYEEGMNLIKELEVTLNTASEKFEALAKAGDLVEKVIK